VEDVGAIANEVLLLCSTEILLRGANPVFDKGPDVHWISLWSNSYHRALSKTIKQLTSNQYSIKPIEEE
jgi:hypothetical protein